MVASDVAGPKMPRLGACRDGGEIGRQSKRARRGERQNAGAPPRSSRCHLCARLNLKFDDVVCELVEKWILGRTIELLEASAENEEGSAGGEPAKG
jgi:hypothetical protein